MRRCRRKQNRTIAIIIAAHCLAAVLLHSSAVVSAQQVPVVHYNVRDGLAYSRVLHIYQDAKSYIWFGTWEGLSRFDGYGFTNYGARDGLESPLVTMTTEDRKGRLWVSTWGRGVARLIEDPEELLSFQQGELQPSARKKFIHYPVGNLRQSNEVYGLIFDGDNTLWCFTYLGLYRGIENQTGGLDFEIVAPHSTGRPLQDWPRGAFRDSQGRLWFGIADELIEINQGQVTKHTPPDEARRKQIMAIAEDPQRALYVAYPDRLFKLDNHEWKRIPLILKPDQQIRAMTADSTGALWIGTPAGLIKYNEGRQTLYTTAQGLSDDHIRSSDYSAPQRGAASMGRFPMLCSPRASMFRDAL